MLIKARRVAGDDGLAHEFLEMIQPFRFPRSINEGVLREVAAMKDRIETEVVRAGELDRNVKLGRGGIREVEFVAQAQQLLHAGRQPFLQGAQTLPCLEKLAEYRHLAAAESEQLDAAYRFLRDVEHRLQMEANLQTHTIPTDLRARERLAKLMGFATPAEFEDARQAHTQNVRRVYDRLLKAESSEPTAQFPREFEGQEAEWKRIFTEHSFRDPDKAFRVLKEFVEGPGFVHVSRRTVELAQKLLPRLFELCPASNGKASNIQSGRRRRAGSNRAEGDSGMGHRPSIILSDPDRVVTRLDSFVSAYGARGALFEMWSGSPALFELLLLLFDRSEFLAEAVIRSPELFDELVFGDRLRQRKTAAEILADLRHGLKDPDQFVWLRRYHEAELLRLGLRDILGLVDFEQNLAELSALADACLQYALEVVMRKHKLKTPPLVIIGFGKLGGCEIDYGSDLDVVFVANSKTKNLPKLQGLAVELMDLVSRRTDKGTVFRMDARLRPDGEKGLLVNTLAAYEDYYRQRAQFWEIQALTRVRAVAGELELGRCFQELAARLTNFKSASPFEGDEVKRHKSSGGKCVPVKRNETPHVISYTADWKRQIHSMRMRIEKERTPTGQDELAIKTGKGGLMDAEFVAQALCLEHGWQEANTLRALERARDAVRCPAFRMSSSKSTLKRGHQTLTFTDWDKLIENYRPLRRVEGILRRWSYEGETVLPDDPAPYYRVSVRCGFGTPEAFRKALAGWRAAIREVYLKVFGGGSHPS